MTMKEEIKTLADTIIWLAEKRREEERFTNINSAINTICVELNLELCDFMKDKKDVQNKTYQKTCTRTATEDGKESI